MAKHNDLGITYFSFDVNFKSHPKVAMMLGQFQTKGYVITCELLCYIYGQKGYYLVWDEKTKLLFANSVAWCGASVNLCEEIVSCLVKWEFFNKSLFNSANILTNERCQKNWLDATRKRKTAGIIPEYDLLSKSSGKTAEELPKTAEVLLQSKVNESKEEKLTKEIPEGCYFNLGGKLIQGTAIDYLKSKLTRSWESTMMNQGYGMDKSDIIRKFTEQYPPDYAFENDNHLQKALLYVIDKMRNPSKQQTREKSIKRDDLSQKDIYANG